MSRKLICVLSILAAGVCLAACSSDPAARASGEKKEGDARQVRVTPSVLGNMARVVVVSGTLAAEEQVVLGSKVAGRLAEMRVDIGTRVKQGDVLARLEPTDLRLRVDQAEAALQQARVRLGLKPEGTDERVEPERTSTVRQARAMLDEANSKRDRAAQLFEQQLIARTDLDAAVAGYQVAEGRYEDAVEEVRNRQALLAQRRSELELARQQWIASELKAPFDGAVRERNALPGEYIAVGAPVVTLVRIHPLRLRLAIPEREAASVRAGQAVTLRVEGDAAAYLGRVARLSPAIEEGNRTLMVEAEVPNQNGALRPGSFARAEIETESDQKVVIVPASAVVTFAGIEKVIVVQDGKSFEKAVQTGRRSGDRVEIVQGLSAGEQVVVQPGNLVGGQAVTVVQ